MTREDIEKALQEYLRDHPGNMVDFALDMVRRAYDESMKIINAARYEPVDLRSLVARIREAKP